MAVVDAYETVRLQGRFDGAEAGTALEVQARRGDGWRAFPLPTMVNEAGRFSAFAEMGRPGRYQLRVMDSESGRTSNVVAVRVR
jgi:hypothetical protein